MNDDIRLLELPAGITEHIERDEVARTALYLAFALPAALLKASEGDQNRQYALTGRDDTRRRPLTG